jgi:hypothetical protein
MVAHKRKRTATLSTRQMFDVRLPEQDPHKRVAHPLLARPPRMCEDPVVDDGDRACRLLLHLSGIVRGRVGMVDVAVVLAEQVVVDELLQVGRQRDPSLGAGPLASHRTHEGRVDDWRWRYGYEETPGR